ncbi:hypothetical protein RJO15_04530 [Herbaspirillum huttiense F1]|uniref:hypothetical protein n=1 Tax=Herbaspirillum huttiense TaxID=863372 RepID=UPI0010650A6A|nr:hypothetical protein [Herbaspirillum huttiense]MDT0355027.1 hypothetical protein [Herbaspirillum huttiense F1]
MEAIEQERKMLITNAASRLAELYLWWFLALIVAGGIFLDLIFHRASTVEVITSRYLDFLLAILVALFPVLFRQIFGRLPLESLRRTLALRERMKHADVPLTTSAPEGEVEWSLKLPFAQLEVNRAEVEASIDSRKSTELAEASATKLFAYYALSSGVLAQRIFNRAGVYLLTGGGIAFSGLAFFYLQTGELVRQSSDSLSLLIAIAPKAGILFFIEFVALFFLRQYRSAMDEFRYYESIKRSREETLVLLRLGKDSGKEFDPVEFAKSGYFFSKAGTLENGQTTEILESRKLEKNEIELLDKVIEVVSNSKKQS